MSETRDWTVNRDSWVRLLETRTGESIAVWNRRIRAQRVRDERSLRAWLAGRGVTGYAQSLLVMERFGYPDFLLASADQLIDQQYADRRALRPILKAIIVAATRFGPLIVQARKTYVSLVSQRRTFARVQPTTQHRLDLCLRLDGQKPTGRLRPCRIHETMQVQIGLTTRADLDDDALAWLRRAYDENS
jgi:hypothetical protein